MTYRMPAPARTRSVPAILGAGLVVVIVAITGLFGHPLLSPASSTPSSSAPTLSHPSATSRIPVLPSGPAGELGEVPGAVPGGSTVRGPRQGGGLGEADGIVPTGTTIFDGDVPGVANLDPDLREALRRAATDAAGDGIEIFVTSGWRSPKYQAQLLHDAISKCGSKEEAARWVATPTTSPHVSGDAVDIGLADATVWLSRHGPAYGLCQIYGNEPWHFELRPGAVDDGCPPMYADPTHDPRMQP